jgi:branched-chain amino acid transport system permease protein
MLDFAMTVLAEPDLILLDEPCAGLSKYETEKMILAISKLAKTSKATFIIVEHDMHVVELLSDNVFVMHQGKLLAQGSLEEIRANKEVQVVYAGGSK